MPQVAIAPDPPPPIIAIVGATVYPLPAFVNIISFIECTPPRTVVIATAVALCSGFPVVDSVIDTVGVEV